MAGEHSKPNVIKRAVEHRPTETATGIGLAAVVYAFLSEAGVDNALAAIIAVILAFVPAAISEAVDRLRPDEEPEEEVVLFDEVEEEPLTGMVDPQSEFLDPPEQSEPKPKHPPEEP